MSLQIRGCLTVAIGLAAASFPVQADWRVLSPHEQRQPHPPNNFSGGTPIQPGDHWPTDQKFRWLIGDLQVPETIDKEPANGKTVGLQINCGDGGEVFLGDE